MAYNVTINGKKYTLPKRTLEVDTEIEHLAELETQNAPILERRTAQYDFLCKMIDDVPEAFDCTSVNDIEVNEMLKAIYAIMNAYKEPELKAIIDEGAKQIDQFMNKPNIRRAVDLAARKM